MRTGSRTAALAALAAATITLYVALAQVGRWLGEFDTLTVFYLPAGLAVAAGMVAGWRAWPVLAVGEFLGGIVVFDIDGVFSVGQMVLNAAGYSGVYVLAATVLRRAGIVALADRLRRAVAVLVVGVVAAPFLAASFGVGMQVWAGLADGSMYWSNVRTWWVGDAVGVATLTPALMVVALIVGVGRSPLVPPSLRRDPPAVTALVLVMPAVIAAVVVIAGDGRPGVIAVSISPLVFVALRTGVAGTAFSCVVLAPTMTILADTTVDTAAFDRVDLQILLLAAFVVSLLIGVVVDERERVGQRHRELASIVETTTDFVTTVRRDGRLEYVNPAARRLAGLDVHGDLSSVDESELYAPGTNAELVEEARRAAEREGEWRGQVLLAGPDGQAIPASKLVIAHYSSDDEPVRTTSMIRDVTDQHRLQRQLERRALEDDLSGLPNRTAFVQHLEQLRRRLRTDRETGALLVVKLDRFGIVMEGLGMETGDVALREMGQRMLLVAGAHALVARLEGVTFGVLPEHPMPEFSALALGDELVASLGEPLLVGDRTLPLSASVGVAEITDEHVSVPELVRRADVAAHRAQGRGGAQVVWHEESMSAAARAAFSAETRLREAIHEGSWWLNYQPIARAGSREIVSAEALLRFARVGSSYPMVVLAEELGLIVPLGRQILERALADAARWPERPPGMCVNVNVSRRQLSSPTFVEDIERALEHSGVQASSLVIEVTETAVSDDPVQSKDVLERVRSLGARVALDDFGTGQSSLATLDRLPIDIVKLDRAFTVNLPRSARTRSVVGSTIELARSLGLVVVAEGVEDDDQHELLVELHCDEIQGFLMARPMPPEDFLGLLGIRPSASPRKGS